MLWVYLSPHLDDVALSCGGLVWQQSQNGENVHIWTICAGDPPEGPLSPFAQSLHQRWQTGLDAMAIRRAEDLRSCALLLATAHHFSIPDCIYRGTIINDQHTFLYASEDALFDRLHPAEEPLVDRLVNELSQELPREARMVCPLALGGHVDHRLVRAAAERLGHDLLYYADYPYMLKSADEIASLAEQKWQRRHYPISADGLAAWQNAVAAHESQISTFWANQQAMKSALKSDLEQFGGLNLWKKTPF